MRKLDVIKRIDRKVAMKAYFRYFRIGFILIAILGIIVIILSLVKGDITTRTNHNAPAERVFDYADVLTATQENDLRRLIAQKEDECGYDFVLVTAAEDFTTGRLSYEISIQNYADDFYDEHGFGYNKPQGNGVILVDNWLEGQEGSWLSTCGRAINKFGETQIDELLDEVEQYIYSSSYLAYKAYVEEAARILMGGSLIPPWIMVCLPLIVALFYVVANLHVKLGKNEVRSDSYVTGKQPIINITEDAFLGKHVTKRIVPRVQSSGGGGGSGRHISRGGVSHGGGGRRR
ncbi:MAG: TPM domain-containing protein [Clostridium sp.]|jgi:uncharacterized membrane protein YgcG|nr:TPM domain-containing protein [Clostridium sp.]